MDEVEKCTEILCDHEYLLGDEKFFYEIVKRTSYALWY